MFSWDESFMDFYEPDEAILKQPMESVFLEVELKDESPDAELYLDNCWVTGSLDFNSAPRWNIAMDGQVVIEQPMFLSEKLWSSIKLLVCFLK